MKINTHVGNVDIKIDTKRIDDNVRTAQRLLNEQIVTDCEPLIPFQQGALQGSVNYPDGIYGGVIEYNTPYAHYQYEGEIYGPNIPIYDGNGKLTGYFSPPKKNPTGRPLHYHTDDTTDHWFEKAKKQHKDDWVQLVGKTIGRD